MIKDKNSYQKVKSGKEKAKKQEKKKTNKSIKGDEITLQSNILEIMEKYPDSVEIFIEYGLPCVGCMAAAYETLEHIVAEFGIDGEKLVQDLRQNCQESEKPKKRKTAQKAKK